MAPISSDPAAGLNPDDVARRTFSAVRKGYDPIEVQSFLVSVASELREARTSILELEREVRAAQAEAERNRDLDPSRLTSLLGEEMSRVLEAARAASDEMRAKALADSTQLLDESRAEADRMKAEAAEILAVKTAEAEAQVAEIAAQGDELRAQAELDAAAEVEKGRQEGREMVAEAQKVRERMLQDLARRRKAFRQQIERLQAGRDRLLTRLRRGARHPRHRHRRAPGGVAGGPPGGRGGGAAGRGGGAVAGGSRARGGQPAADRRRAGSRSGGPGVRHGGRAGGRAGSRRRTETTRPRPRPRPTGVRVGVRRRSTSSSATSPSPRPSRPSRWRAPALNGSDSEGNVSSLFARLKEETETPTAAEASAETGEGAVAVVVEEVEVIEVVEATGDPDAPFEVVEEIVVEQAVVEILDVDDAEELEEAEEPDPDTALVARRDVAMVEVERTLSRRIKRELSDEQNELLDAVRRQKGTPTVDKVLPALDAHLSRYRDAALPGLAAAATAGADLLDGKGPAPKTKVGDLADELAKELIEPLRDRIENCFREAAGDDEELAERLRACYREWKGQRVDEASSAPGAGRGQPGPARPPEAGHAGALDRGRRRDPVARLRRQRPGRGPAQGRAVPHGARDAAHLPALPLPGRAPPGVTRR